MNISTRATSMQRLLHLMLFALLLLPVKLMAASYLINLQSSTTPIDIQAGQIPPGYSANLFTSTFSKGGTKWYRLQLGHFESLKAARDALQQLKQHYPGAWISKAPTTIPKQSALQKVAASSAVVESPRLADKQTHYPYVVNLQVTYEAAEPATLPPLQLPRGAILYSTSTQRMAQSWHYLRVGFFADREGASRWAKRLSKNYPAAKAMKVTRHERDNAHKGEIAPSSIATISFVDEQDATPAKAAHSMHKLEEARRAMVDGAYQRAIKFYRELIEDNDTTTGERQHTLELLALAYERSGNEGQARKYYRDYLQQYPEGQGSDRVRQRLISMESATALPKEKLREVKKVAREKRYLYGSLSLYYRHDADIQDSSGTAINQSSLQGYLDLTGRSRSDEHDLRARITTGYQVDLQNSNSSSNNVSNLYVDYSNRLAEWSARAGRQSGNSGGVLGRFDGIRLSKQISATNKLNLVMGNPVASSSDSLLQSDSRFYGISTDLGTFARSWDFQAYLIQQSAGSYIDRRAVGGEVRYFQPNRSLFGLVDYDLSFQSLNTLLLIGGVTLKDKGRINFMIDQRNSPTLTLSNALQGQSATTLAELALSYNEDEIEQLALDRTARSRSWMVGYNRPLNSRYQFSSDITVSSTSATPASGGVAATDASGTDYYINLRLNVKEFLFKDDLTLLSLQYSNTRDMNTTTLGMSSRFTYNKDWRLNPRIYLDLRQNSVSADNYIVLRPSFSVTNHHWNKHTFEFESGFDLTTQAAASDGYYFNLGYRWRF